jgi:hypothetical protein
MKCCSAPPHVFHRGQPPPCSATHAWPNRGARCLCGSASIPWADGLPSNFTLVLNKNRSRLGSDCSTVGCAAVYPTELLLDASAGLGDVIMSLKDGDDLATNLVLGDTWDPAVAPCSGNLSILGCELCDDGNMCGAINPNTGRRFCKFRYVECINSQRVTGIRMPYGKVSSLGGTKKLTGVRSSSSRKVSGPTPSVLAKRRPCPEVAPSSLCQQHSLHVAYAAFCGKKMVEPLSRLSRHESRRPLL